MPSQTIPSLLALAITLWVAGCSGPLPPQASDGVLDLRSWSFEKHGPVSLQGKWDFFWAEQKSASTDNPRAPAPLYFSVPSFWNGTRLPDGSTIGGAGFGTLRLRVLLPDRGAPEEYGAYLHESLSAYRLLIGPDRVLSSGNPGRTAESTPFAYNLPAQGHFTAHKEVTLYLQISNFYNARGGPNGAALFGHRSQIRQTVRFLRHADFFTAGIIVIIGLYNLTLFLLRPADRAPLFLGLFCLAIAYRTILVGGYVQERYPDMLPGSFYAANVHIVYFLSVPLFVRFAYHLFPETVTLTFTRIISLTAALFVTTVLVLPGPMYTNSLYIYHLVSAAVITWILAAMIRAGIQRRGDSTPWISLVGFFLFSTTITIDILANLALINAPRVLHFGLSAFIFCQAAVIAVNNNRARRTIEHLAGELESRNVRLNRVDRMKDQFLANTSHELRTPLNGIIGLAESLLEGVAGEVSTEVRSNIGMIAGSGKRLAALVDDLLDLSQIRKGELQIHRRAVRLQDVTRVVVALSEPLIRGSEVRLINEVSAEFPALFADENRLQQILHNLIGNAIKFTERGTIRIAARRVDPKRGDRGAAKEAIRTDVRWAEVNVSDTGIGIPAEKLEDMFQPFEQGASRTAVHEGVGLGLSISRHLLELQGGSISVQSEPGRGSVFTFRLPIASSEAVEAGLAEISTGALTERQPAATESRATQAGEGPVVLIVDDDAINLRVLENHLLPRGYRVRRAQTGREALALARADPKPDIVLLDIMLPDISGYDVCREIRIARPVSDLPIILITARNQTNDMIIGFAAGANDYLTKPIQGAELATRMDFQLRLRNTVTELETLRESLEQRVTTRTRELNTALGALQDRERNLNFELQVASRIQRGILPTTPLSASGYFMTAHYESMEQVGGDFFDIVPLPDGLQAVLLADVSGHGVPAALVTTMTKIAFADAARKHPAPHEMLRLLNESTLTLIKTQEFITAMCLLLEPDGLVHYSSAGHPPAFLLRKGSGAVDTLKTNGALLGLFEEAASSFSTESTRMHQGDRLLVYTDGISENMDQAGRVFGSSRIKTLLYETRDIPVEEACRMIVRTWQTHGEIPDDDATLLLIERQA